MQYIKQSAPLESHARAARTAPDVQEAGHEMSNWHISGGNGRRCPSIAGGYSPANSLKCVDDGSGLRKTVIAEYPTTVRPPSGT